MEKEMSALIANDTWEDIQVLDSDVVPISWRWILSVKRNGTHNSLLEDA
jgi:hypothetical protein